ncbi:extracellular solute-binding protein [Parasphaerochaeta coccoides]|uniref:Extracellular solute-binding protein family 1 n=1 Tax=Parasphaerochaeta coccoides (strain ATCC BAA-1237 / DSM 17374 / SPN1) TaxID=760011 RepID=F4GK74_PARC1|nr:extracellular solute-binding protein [Parasphaerochaeta coccoides]AEC02270.1 extracellular solute-binding protein family 1 [Parasphaerochaeta coccoides DSM 17374]
MNGKRITLVFVSIFMGVCLLFAGGAKESRTSDAVVTLNFWHHYSAQSKENETLTKVLIPRFEAENPGIKVNAVSHEWAELHDKILVSSSAMSLPDVARCDIAWLPEFEKMGILVPLDREFEDFTQVAGRILPSAMSTAFVNGHYHGLGLNTNTKILFYNTKLLEDAKLSVPTTMDEWMTVVRALSGKNTRGQQVWGWNEPSLGGWNLGPFIWSFGGAFTDPAQTKATGYLNSEETVRAIDAFVTLAREGALTGFNSGDIPMTDGFGTYRYAMMLEGPWKVAELKGAYPDVTYGMAPMPAGKGGSSSVLGGEDIAMFTTAKKDAAWKFMQFMTGKFAQTEMAKAGQIPVNQEALKTEEVKNAEFSPFLSAIETAKARPTVSVWTEIDNLLSMTISNIIRENKDVRTSLDALAAQVDELLKP